MTRSESGLIIVAGVIGAVVMWAITVILATFA